LKGDLLALGFEVSKARKKGREQHIGIAEPNLLSALMALDLGEV
jgi:hypothetical protein